jgi:hypothetical protein
MHDLFEIFRRFKIQTRLVVYYITFALITLSALVYFSYIQSVKFLQTTIEDKLRVITELKIDNLDRWVNEQQKNAVFLASLPELRSLSSQLLDSNSSKQEKDIAHKELTNLLSIIVQRTADFQDIQIIDLNGKVVVSMLPGVIGVSQADQPFFREGISKTSIQPFYESSLLGDITSTISTPLFDELQNRVGILALHFNMRHVDEIIRENPNMNELEQNYLITPDRQFITEDPILVTKSQDPSSLAILSALQGKHGSASYTNHNGTAVIGRYLWLGDHNAALVVELDEKTALSSARELAMDIAITGIAISILLVLFVIFMALPPRSFRTMRWVHWPKPSIP